MPIIVSVDIASSSSESSAEVVDDEDDPEAEYEDVATLDVSLE